jgi:hypothetical protein
MTAPEAKVLSLQLWKYLRDNPSCQKHNVPESLWHKIEYMLNACPLCEYFFGEDSVSSSEHCPLDVVGHCANCADGYYAAWRSSRFAANRMYYASKIITLIAAWKTEHSIL